MTADVHPLQRFFDLRSVAIIGASSDPDNDVRAPTDTASI
jgi:hypothetical protein